MKRYIIPFLVTVAIILTVFYYTTEGFQTWTTYNTGNASEFYKQTDSVKKCMAYKTCSSCLTDSGCGWAGDYAEPAKGLQGVVDGTILACIPQVARKPFISSDLANLMIQKNGARTLTNFTSTLGDCTDVMCSEKTKCGDCVKFNKCAWQQRTAADKTMTQVCINKVDAGPADTSKNTITSSDKCPVPQCSDITDCLTCTNTTDCGFCTISGKCLKSSEFGTGTNQCAVANKVTEPASCPCGGITSCTECAGRVGCAFCKNKSMCVNLDKNGMPPKDSCTQDDALTSESQCNAPSMQQLSAAVDTRSADGPTNSQLYSAGDGGNWNNDASNTVSTGISLQTNTVRANSGNPVSEGKTYSVMTAPGVARSVGASSVPATVRNEPRGDDAPLESYVKMLVNSQLAAQGIPTNEPFQLNESSTIANASDYLKKVFRGVL